MAYPKFSIIIPQKNRSEYLYHTIRTCMIQDYPNLDIIISDDCSDDDSVEMVKSLMSIDKRIKLFDHKKHLGMRDNFEFALNQCTEGYVIALGGDDGLLPGAITKMYEIINETKRELITWPTTGFIYPEPNGDSKNNLLFIPRKHKPKSKIINSEEYLNHVANTLFYMTNECPMFYVKGVASVNLINKVKNRTKDGSFYYCPTPDGFSGIVLAGEVVDFIYHTQPLSIMGTTHKSQGKNYMRTDKESKKEAEEFFNDNIRRTMHDELASQPYSPLITLMTADYLLTAKDLPGWPGKFKMFSFESLLIKSFEHLSVTPYENDVLIRELRILKKIAECHNLDTLFDSLYKNTKRKIRHRGAGGGNAITHSIRLNGSLYGINNIFDASLVADFIFQLNKKFRFRDIPEIFINSSKIFLNSHKVKTISLPDIN